MKRIIFLVLILASANAFSQNITTQNLSWQISRMDDITSGAFDERGGTIQSYGTDRAEWHDASGALKQTFTIKEVNGAWANIQNTGTILYEAVTDNKQATITFLRNGQELRVRIGILTDDAEPQIYEFAIQNYTTL